MATNNAINLKDAGIVTYDGAGTFTGSVVAQHSSLVAGSANSVIGLPLTNGQVLIGSTGAQPVPSTITAGTGISITNAAGSITVNASGSGLKWSIITASSHQALVNEAYVANNAGLITFTLPAAAALGDAVAIKGLGAGGFKLALNTNQYIIFGKQVTTTSTGYIQTTNQYDTVMVHCITPPEIWSVTIAVGNFTYV